ncbi:MAG: hypothetical protein ACLP7I_00255 [Limisphaerales bacterium]
MRFIIPYLVCFLVGVGIGWYVGHTLQIAEARRVVNQGMTKVEEVYDAAEARSALRAVPIIQSADTKQAVDWFARPIAIYYHKFAGEACTNSERQILRDMIEQLASTNKIVADAIHTKIQ